MCNLQSVTHGQLIIFAFNISYTLFYTTIYCYVFDLITIYLFTHKFVSSSNEILTFSLTLTHTHYNSIRASFHFHLFRVNLILFFFHLAKCTHSLIISLLSTRNLLKHYGCLSIYFSVWSSAVNWTKKVIRKKIYNSMNGGFVVFFLWFCFSPWASLLFVHLFSTFFVCQCVLESVFANDYLNV